MEYPWENEFKNYCKETAKNKNGQKETTLNQYCTDVIKVLAICNISPDEMCKDKDTLNLCINKYKQYAKENNLDKKTINSYSNDCKRFYKFWNEKKNNDIKVLNSMILAMFNDDPTGRKQYSPAEISALEGVFGEKSTHRFYCKKNSEKCSEVKNSGFGVNCFKHFGNNTKDGKYSLSKLGIKMGKKLSNKNIKPLNQILYGPPGTGKTFNTINKAIGIIGIYSSPTTEDYIKWYKENKYRPNKADSKTDTIDSYRKELNKWINTGFNLFEVTTPSELEQFRNKVSTYLDEKGQSSSKWITTLTQDENYIEFHKYWNEISHESLNREELESKFYKEIKKDSNDSSKQIEFITFHQSYSYEEFVEGIKPNIEKNTDNLKFEENQGIFKIICNRAEQNPDKKYVLIIDEINRGNISKIFGELITLIEEDKRETMTVTLPYSKKAFTVPKNLYIIGTMNTADKSLALLDVALRRRFEFIPKYPEYKILDENQQNKVHYSEFLKELNKKILEKKKTADYFIGHSYFMDKNGEKPQLKDVLNNCVIPLLMEYFNGKIDDVKTMLKDIDNEIEFDKEFAFEKENDYEYYYLQVKTVSGKWDSN